MQSIFVGLDEKIAAAVSLSDCSSLCKWVSQKSRIQRYNYGALWNARVTDILYNHINNLFARYRAHRLNERNMLFTCMLHCIPRSAEKSVLWHALRTNDHESGTLLLDRDSVFLLRVNLSTPTRRATCAESRCRYKRSHYFLPYVCTHPCISVWACS